MYKAVRIPLCITVIAMSLDVAFSQEPVSKCADHQTLFQGMRDARMRLTSGVCRGRGHRLLRESMEGDSSFFCAFDYVNNRIRSDREDPIIVTDPEKQTTSVKQIGYRLVQTPERTIYLDLGGGLNTTDILSVAAPDFRPPPYGVPIAVRIFGLADSSSIDGGATFEKALETREKWKVASTREEPDGRCVVTFLPLENVQVELWINSDRGYTVERSEMRTLDEAAGKWSEIRSFGDVTWEQRNDVWVPTSIYLERHFNGRETYYSSLEWESVNQEPSAKLFEPDGLGVDPESVIVDVRLGVKPVVIGRIKDGGRPPTLRLPPPPSVAPKTSRLFWLLAGNVVALAVVGVAYLWRRNRRIKRL